MLNLVARTHSKETVLVLSWQRGTLLALHSDGRLAEYKVADLRADLLESQMRIATNEQANRDLFAEVAEG